MKKIGVIIVLFVGCSLHAQTFEEFKRQTQATFEQFRTDTEKEFNDFREKANAEFADFMRKSWKQFESQPAEPAPALPEPPEPVVKEETTEEPSNTPIKLGEIIPPVKAIPIVQPVVPIPKLVPTEPTMPSETTEPSESIKPAFAFTYYGTPCAVSLTEDMRFYLPSVHENTIADIWELLSSPRYLNVVAECLEWRDSLALSDWGYIRFTDAVSYAFFKRHNEAKLLQMFILVQSGYKVRIARYLEQLYLFMPSTDRICEQTYVKIDGIPYYCLDKYAQMQSLYVFAHEFPGEQTFSLQQHSLPRLESNPSEQRNLLSANRYPGTMVLLKSNENLMNYYAEYPICEGWDTYAAAGLSEESKKQLYAVLRRTIFQKSYTEAADILLNFVQSAFAYKTDDEQFGRERPLFGDETLYYPYCDCEDRAILYANMIHDLLYLDVVLVHFPGTETTAGHVATAVHFREDVVGDYLMIDGKKYTICDPTYIGAAIGEAMPQYHASKANVQKIPWP